MMFTTTDPFGRNITLRRREWEGHIAVSHPQMTVNAIKVSIECPNVIRASTRHPDRDIYFGLGAHKKYPSLYVQVVVSFQGDQGRVITAHLADDLEGSGLGEYKYVSRT